MFLTPALPRNISHEIVRILLIIYTGWKLKIFQILKIIKMHEIMLPMSYSIYFLICITILGCGGTIYLKRLTSASINASTRLIYREQAFFIRAAALMQNYCFISVIRESLVL